MIPHHRVLAAFGTDPLIPLLIPLGLEVVWSGGGEVACLEVLYMLDVVDVDSFVVDVGLALLHSLFVTLFGQALMWRSLPWRGLCGWDEANYWRYSGFALITMGCGSAIQASLIALALAPSVMEKQPIISKLCFVRSIPIVILINEFIV